MKLVDEDTPTTLSFESYILLWMSRNNLYDAQIYVILGGNI